MGNTIQINDGSEVFDIVNTRGELLGQFTFIPSDFDIVRRYEETVQKFEEMQRVIEEKIEREKAEQEKTEQDGAGIEYLKELDVEMGKQVDYLFNAQVSEKFFSITSPFTILNSGEFFVENVINAIRSVVEQKRDVKLKAVENHVKKYTDKYKAGPGGYLKPTR